MPTVVLDIRSLPQAIRELAQHVEADIVEIIREETHAGLAAAIEEATEQGLVGAGDPTHYTESFKYAETPRGGLLTNDSPYADAIEYGARPHRPPMHKLVAWAQAKFGVSEEDAEDIAGAAFSKISREGLPPRFVMGNVLVEIEAAIRKRIRAYTELHARGQSPAALRLRARYGGTSRNLSIK